MSKTSDIEELVSLVQSIVAESGEPKGFNAARWVAKWIDTPLPALGGVEPSKMLKTPDGKQLVIRLLRQAQSGAYA